jgi:LysM repeat protein
MRLVGIFTLLFISFGLMAQNGTKLTRQQYIDTYKDLAMSEMKRTGIPASITMAQGILESGDGNSRLARKGNNHFGIKCHDWQGKSLKHDDDRKNECFRKYDSPEESYYDHSDFLTGKQRYAFLFDYKTTDYKAWAKGLKKAGYATSPTYAKALIKVIEENNLSQLDEQVLAGGPVKSWDMVASASTVGERKIFINNRVKYVLAGEGESFENLSEEFNMMSWQLPKYNELPRNHIFSEGEVVYLQPKRKKSEVHKKEHIVQSGETLFDISQKYAVKLESLCRNNGLKPDDKLKEGTKLALRSRNKSISRDKEKTRVVLNTEEEEENAEDFEILFDLDN